MPTVRGRHLSLSEVSHAYLVAFICQVSSAQSNQNKEELAAVSSASGLVEDQNCSSISKRPLSPDDDKVHT